MTIRENNIVFTLVCDDEKFEIETYDGEFRNVMTLINEKIFVNDFGECKGIGRCGTCLIEIDGLDEEAQPIERNERSTLNKCAVQKPNLRLSCQLMINSSLNNCTIRVVEEREDVR